MKRRLSASEPGVVLLLSRVAGAVVSAAQVEPAVAAALVAPLLLPEAVLPESLPGFPRAVV